AKASRLHRLLPLEGRDQGWGTFLSFSACGPTPTPCQTFPSRGRGMRPHGRRLPLTTEGGCSVESADTVGLHRHYRLAPPLWGGMGRGFFLRYSLLHPHGTRPAGTGGLS